MFTVVRLNLQVIISQLWLWVALLSWGSSAQVQAQTPVWASATLAGSPQAKDASTTRAVATDAVGNVFVTGYFSGTVTFGATTLTSAGGDDLFVAKYVPGTSTWAWATRGGGTSFDQGYGLAVSGNSVYVTGYITNSLADTHSVEFQGTGSVPGTTSVNGASPYSTHDLFVAKYTDNGVSATLNWTQVGGGVSEDQGTGLAVSGSGVYVVGTVSNNLTNVNAVVFGGSGTTAGTSQVKGASKSASRDILVAKYVDSGSYATLGWAHVGGGTSTDYGYGIAVSGTSVYATGTLSNSVTDTTRASFGGSSTPAGTMTIQGTSSIATQDLVVVKYIDNGVTAALGWSQVGGGTGDDYGYAVAVSGTSVYVAGTIYNNTTNANKVHFGGTGTTPGTKQQNGASATASADQILVKYTDNGSSAALGWTQVGGGTSTDIGWSLATRGANVYVAGYMTNTASNATGVLFGGSGTASGNVLVNGASSTSSPDLLLTKYIDQGLNASLVWTQVGGGSANDAGYSLALSGQQLYVAGFVTPSATFGGITVTGSSGTSSILGNLTD
jgi:hypothetical protein